MAQLSQRITADLGALSSMRSSPLRLCRALNPQERYEFALKMKEEGNAHLKEGIKDLKDQPIKAAVRKYKLALVYLEENTAEDTVEGDALGLQVSLHLNIAAVAIRTVCVSAGLAHSPCRVLDVPPDGLPDPPSVAVVPGMVQWVV